MRRQVSLPLASMTVNMDLENGSQRLRVLEAGHGIALPQRRTGPLVRENYFLHLVVSGQLSFNGRAISKGRGFLIAPLSPMTLENSFQEPAEHYWLQFGGEDAVQLLERAGIGADTCVFALPHGDEAAALLSHAVYREEGCGSLSLGLLGTLFSLLSLYERPGRAPASWDGVNRYVHAAMEFFRRNYAGEITVEDAGGLCQRQ